MSAAATADAARPATVTPPDAPGAVGWSVRIDRGWAPERDPISVAQVSAAAVANGSAEPGEEQRAGPFPGERRCQRQDRRNAAVGHHLDGIPFPAASLFEMIAGREPAEQGRGDEEREEHAAAADSGPSDTVPPTAVAAMAPLGESARARRAASEKAAAPAKPMTARSG